MTLVGVEVHLAVRMRADQLAVLADVGDQHDRRVVLLVMGPRGGGLAERPEALGEGYHLIFVQRLSWEHDDRKPVPSVENVFKHRIRQRL